MLFARDTLLLNPGGRDGQEAPIDLKTKVPKGKPFS